MCQGPEQSSDCTVRQCPASSICASSSSSQQTEQAVKRCVRFDLDACSVHEIMPYAEIYGMHPRDFVFGKGFHMVPAYHHIPIDVIAAGKEAGPDSDDSDFSDDGDDEDDFDE